MKYLSLLTESELNSENVLVNSGPSVVDASVLYDRDTSTWYNVSTRSTDQAVVWRHTFVSTVTTSVAMLQVTVIICEICFQITFYMKINLLLHYRCGYRGHVRLPSVGF